MRVQLGVPTRCRGVWADRKIAAGLFRVGVALLISRAGCGSVWESANIPVGFVIVAATFGGIVALTIAYGFVKVGVLKEPTVIEASEHKV